jgi:hypothetical protein
MIRHQRPGFSGTFDEVPAMIGDLLDSIRELYTGELADVVARLAHGSERRVYSEVALRDRSGRPIRDGALGLPMRLDLVAVSGATPESPTVDPERLMRFEPVSFVSRAGVDVVLHPCQWDSMTLSFDDPGGLEDWQPLVSWFNEWYRESAEGDDGELLGVVHCLSDPEVTRGSVRFTVDLGSAPVEAFETLLDVIAVLGVKNVVVGDAPRGQAFAPAPALAAVARVAR